MTNHATDLAQEVLDIQCGSVEDAIALVDDNPMLNRAQQSAVIEEIRRLGKEQEEDLGSDEPTR